MALRVPRTQGRTVGAPVSNICAFQADLLPGVSYVAHALSDGCIVVQQAVPGPRPCTAPPGLPAAAPTLPFLTGSPDAPGQYVPVLLIDPVLAAAAAGSCRPGKEAVFELLAWGGGPCYLLAAATRTTLHLFSLRAFFLHEAALAVQAGLTACTTLGAMQVGMQAGMQAQLHGNPGAQQCSPEVHGGDGRGGQGGGGSGMRSGVGLQATMPLPSSSWQCVGVQQLERPLLAMDWTQQGDGLLLSDSGGRLAMWGVQVQGLDSLWVAQGGTPPVVLHQAWSAHSDVRHPLLAAGLHPGRPSASAYSQQPPRTNTTNTSTAAAAAASSAGAQCSTRSSSGGPAPLPLPLLLLSPPPAWGRQVLHRMGRSQLPNHH
ncbi:hypothetical protein V8C86DRAFT_217434 [Haematococcus lacustris]